MKTLKKSLVLLLALAMAVSVFAFGASAVYTDDATIADEYKEAIDVLTAYGVLTGNGADDIEADRTITRGEFAKILYVAYFGGDSAWTTADKYAGFANFNDVSSDDWYAGVIGYATYKGWILGYGDGNFGPEDPVLGVDAITMILRMLGLNAYGELSDGDTYAAKAIDFATQLGMLVNTDKNGVDYDVEITRGAVFEILFRGATEVPVFVKNTDSTYVYKTFELEGYLTPGTTPVTRIAYDDDADYTVFNDRIIVAVPETDSTLKVENKDTGAVTYKVKFMTAGGTVGAGATATRVSNTEVGAEYIGKVVDLRCVKVDGVDVLVGITVVSEEVTVAKDDIEEPAQKSKFTVTDGVLADAVADIEEGETYYALLDKDGKVDSYVTKVVAEDTWKVATFTATENADKEIVVTIEGEEMEVAGVDTKDATYVIAYDMKGVNVVSAQVLNPSAEVKVTSVTTKGGAVTAFVAGGTSYEVYPADGVNGKVVNGVTTTDVANGAKVFVYMLDGKVVYASTTRMPADKEEEVTTPFDGFAELVDARIIVSGEFEDNEWTESSTTATVYAKAKVVLDDGTEAMYFIPVTAETKDDVIHYYVAGPDGKKTEVLTYTKGAEGGFSKEPNADDGTIALTEVFAPGLYAYELNDGDIALYGADNAIIDTDTVLYEVVSVDSAIAAGATTIKNVFAADATFVGKVTVDEKEVYAAYVGSANMPGEMPTGAKAVKMTVKDDEGKVTDERIIVVFGGKFDIKEEATDTKNLVYVDVKTETAVGDEATPDHYEYTALKADNTQITVTSESKLSTGNSGIFKLMSDNSVVAYDAESPVEFAKDKWNLNVTGYIYLYDGSNGEYVALSDVVIYGEIKDTDALMVIDLRDADPAGPVIIYAK